MNAERPDVEALIAEIRRRAVCEPAAEGAPDAQAAAPDDLHSHLKAANESCRVGEVTARGPVGAARRSTHRLLGSLIGDVNRFHAEVVRVLNELVGVLEGERTPASADLLVKTQRRIELLTELSRRLAEVEDLRIAERLQELEERIGKLEGRDKP
jgi:hypothetical protein